MKTIFKIASACLMTAWIGVGGAANTATADDAVGLSPIQVRPLQVSGCVLVGKSFGTLEAGRVLTVAARERCTIFEWPTVAARRPQGLRHFRFRPKAVTV